MGVQHQKQTLYVSDVISLTELLIILQEKMRWSIDANHATHCQRPCDVIDTNQVGMKFLKLPGIRLYAFAKTLANLGIDIIIAADGKDHP